MEINVIKTTSRVIKTLYLKNHAGFLKGPNCLQSKIGVYISVIIGQLFNDKKCINGHLDGGVIDNDNNN